MNPSYTAIGIMSGTSLDGLDIALCHFTKNNDTWKYNVIDAATCPYPKELEKKLANAIDCSSYEFVCLDHEFACFSANKILDFLCVHKSKPDLIASHGHTIFHQPETGLTVQIGSGAVLAAKTGITTVCDFRTVDVALGGQGAPLVPIGDELLFGQYDACLNLGGFSNISYRKNRQRMAFDVSPCNIGLNYLAEKLGLPFDENGEIALQGSVNENLLGLLNNIEYYNYNGAKSLGKEWFERVFRPHLDDPHITVADKLRTLTEHITIQIANVLCKETIETILITGGGARNTFLIERLRDLGNKQIIIPDTQTIDFKEAIIFAFLGILRLRKEHNCLHSVTGANKDSCGGAVYL